MNCVCYRILIFHPFTLVAVFTLVLNNKLDINPHQEKNDAHELLVGKRCRRLSHQRTDSQLNVIAGRTMLLFVHLIYRCWSDESEFEQHVFPYLSSQIMHSFPFILGAQGSITSKSSARKVAINIVQSQRERNADIKRYTSSVPQGAVKQCRRNFILCESQYHKLCDHAGRDGL